MDHSRAGADFAVADVSKLEVRTAPHELTVGMAAAAFGAPRPDLNGLRVKTQYRSDRASVEVSVVS